MKQSDYLLPTRRSISGNHESISHQLLIQAGYIRQVSSGSYIYLPIAQRVLSNIERIIREELEKIGAFELKAPVSILSKREQEEVVYDLIRQEVTSYKQLPLNLFQIQTVFRSKVEPKYGLLQCRENLIMEAYSFHQSVQDLAVMYQKLDQALLTIFSRCGLSIHRITDQNEFGCIDTKTYSLISEIGNQIVCYSDLSDYQVDYKIATSYYQSKKSHVEWLPLEETAEMVGLNTSDSIQSIFLMVDESPTLILLRGDHELNLHKVKQFLQASQIRLGTKEETQLFFYTEQVNLGPFNVPEEVSVYADRYVEDLVNVRAGANQPDKQFKNVTTQRDLGELIYKDFRWIEMGEESPDQKGHLKITHAFSLGGLCKKVTRMERPLKVQNGENQTIPLETNFCRIEISRLLAAVVEQNFDGFGISWPQEIAPFDLHLVCLNPLDSYQATLLSEVEEKMIAAGYDVLTDDRLKSIGVKFADADLIGCPTRITIGKKAIEGVVEIKIKKTHAAIEVRKEELADTLNILLNTMDEQH